MWFWRDMTRTRLMRLKPQKICSKAQNLYRSSHLTFSSHLVLIIATKRQEEEMWGATATCCWSVAQWMWRLCRGTEGRQKRRTRGRSDWSRWLPVSVRQNNKESGIISQSHESIYSSFYHLTTRWIQRHTGSSSHFSLKRQMHNWFFLFLLYCGRTSMHREHGLNSFLTHALEFIFLLIYMLPYVQKMISNTLILVFSWLWLGLFEETSATFGVIPLRCVQTTWHKNLRWGN